MARLREIRLTVVAVCSVAVVVGFDIASAQQAQPAEQAPQQRVECQPGNSAGPHQMIVVVRKDNDCRVQPYYGQNVIPKVHEKVNQPVMWEVCNQCGEDVDVRLWNGSPASLYTIFTNTNPPIATSGIWEAPVAINTSRIVFRGRGKSPTSADQRYDIAVKRRTEGEDGWSGVDPELQIDSMAPVALDWTWIVAAAAGGAAAGFAAGFAVGKSSRA